MLKWACIGLLGALINLMVTIALTEFVGLWYILSSTVATILILWQNFVLNKKWTFRDWSAFQLLLPAK
ncbi:MAG: GtrA family protein [Candidatus Hodarchaeota archaeon]